MSDVKTKETFGDWVLSQRESLGLSRKTLSRKIGVSSEYIRTIEHGLRTPSVPVRVSLEAALNQDGCLSELIYISMPFEGDTYRELSKMLADKIIKAGYRKLV